MPESNSSLAKHILTFARGIDLESTIKLPNVCVTLAKPFTTAELLQALINIQIE